MEEDDDISPFRAPHELESIDREIFAFAFQLAHSAGGLAMVVENPEQFGINLIDEEEDKISEIRFTDNPLNRAMFALKEHFGEGNEMFKNFSMRFFAMFPIMRSEEVKEWEKPDPSDSRATLLHPAVIFASAETPLNTEGEFDLDKFFQTVSIIDSELDDAEP